MANLVLIDGSVITREQLTLDIPMSAYTLFVGPDAKKDSDWKDDCEFFRTNPDRNLCIRRAVTEFNEREKIATYARLGVELPPLWIMVRQESCGFFTITACWRGAAFWSVRHSQVLQEYDACDSDRSVLELYRTMHLHGGMSKPCMERLWDRGKDFALLHVASQRSNSPVH